MSAELDALVLDLVEWVAREPRSYTDLFDAWRTSCPRLPVWEEACDRGFVTRATVPGRGVLVTATVSGRKFLQDNGRPSFPAVPERGVARLRAGIFPSK